MATSTVQVPIKTKVISSGSMTIAANARSYQDIALPPDCKQLLSATIAESPNADWVIARIQFVSDSTITIYYKNEYSGSLTGEFSVRIAYL